MYLLAACLRGKREQLQKQAIDVLLSKCHDGKFDFPPWFPLVAFSQLILYILQMIIIFLLNLGNALATKYRNGSDLWLDDKNSKSQ